MCHQPIPEDPTCFMYYLSRCLNANTKQHGDVLNLHAGGQIPVTTRANEIYLWCWSKVVHMPGVNWPTNWPHCQSQALLRCNRLAAHMLLHEVVFHEEEQFVEDFRLHLVVFDKQTMSAACCHLLHLLERQTSKAMTTVRYVPLSCFRYV